MERGMMEQIEINYQRELALSLAVQFTNARPGFFTYDVENIAQSFLNWLNNVEVN
jgi:hypothetical protein